MFLAQGHTAVTSVRLEPGTPRSPVKHPTTEPLCSIFSTSCMLISLQNWIILLDALDIVLYCIRHIKILVYSVYSS